MGDIEIDLYGDWVKYLRNELSGFGYSDIPPNNEAVVHTYLNLVRRLIQPIPRMVLKSSEFACPPQYQQGLADVERQISHGRDLRPYLSKELTNPRYNDHFLNDWGIHHLHLGHTLEPDGRFMVRSGPVLCCRFEKAVAYFIQVISHGEWAKQELVAILHRNWPESIKQFRLKTVTGMAVKLTDQDIRCLRRKNVNTVVDIGNGVMYGQIGGGFTASGISVDVVMKADYYKMKFQQMQTDVIDNIADIARAGKAKGVFLPNTPQFRLAMKGNQVFAVEVNCRLEVFLESL